MATDLPAFYFYVGDLWKDNQFRLCGWQAQNLWLRILLLLHAHVPRGEFRMHTGEPMTDEQVSKLCEMPITDFRNLMTELDNNGVSTRIAGAIANRRMVRERELLENKRKAGRLAMEHRWHKHNASITEGDNKTIGQNATYSSSFSSSSSSSSSKEIKKKKSLARSVGKQPTRAVTDEEWIQSLKVNPIYAGLDLELERRKAEAWITTNGRGRKFTRKFFGNWLVRALSDKPITKDKPPPRGRNYTSGYVFQDEPPEAQS